MILSSLESTKSRLSKNPTAILFVTNKCVRAGLLTTFVATLLTRERQFSSGPVYRANYFNHHMVVTCFSYNAYLYSVGLKVQSHHYCSRSSSFPFLRINKKNKLMLKLAIMHRLLAEMDNSWGAINMVLFANDSNFSYNIWNYCYQWTWTMNLAMEHHYVNGLCGNTIPEN